MTIYLSLEKEKPDISVRFVEKDQEDIKKFIDEFDKILQTFKDPVELKVIDESKKNINNHTPGNSPQPQSDHGSKKKSMIIKKSK